MGLDLFGHADAVIANFEDDSVAILPGSDGDGAALMESFDGVKNQNGDDLSDFMILSHDGRNIFQLRLYLYVNAFGFRLRSPSGFCEEDALFDDLIEVDQGVRALLPAQLAIAGKTLNSLCGFFCRAVDVFQKEVHFLFIGFGIHQQHLAEPDDRRKPVVQIVCDAYDHLSQGTGLLGVQCEVYTMNVFDQKLQPSVLLLQFVFICFVDSHIPHGDEEHTFALPPRLLCTELIPGGRAAGFFFKQTGLPAFDFEWQRFSGQLLLFAA